jgi:putative hydroxymethylpyrimidine transport system ATP-binding protein
MPMSANSANSEIEISNQPAQAALGIELVGAGIRYQDSSIATLANLNLSLDAQKWTVILGRSGCGKTTVLRYMAGLLEDKVAWNGSLTTSDGKPLSGRIAYMAQQDLLLPWLTVVDNVCLSHRFGANSMASKKETQNESNGTTHLRWTRPVR